MATIRPTTVPSKRLSESITAASSSFKVNNIEGWDGVDLTSASFGTVAYAVFRNSAGTQLEIIEIDPTTVTSASAAITMSRRGLKFDGDLTTEVSANKLAWVKGDTIVEFGTHVPQLLRHAVTVVEDQTVAGVKTFSSVPKTTGGDATTSTELVRKAQLDAAVLGSATLTPVIVPGNGGETLAIDQLVYQKASDQEWYKCDADTAATVDNVTLGITRGAGSDGVAITSGVHVLGRHTASSAVFTQGKVFASNTAGGFSASAGTVEVSLGLAVSTTVIDFFPRYDQVLTENQQDLITAIEGGTDFYAASAVGTDSYAITIAPPITAYVTGMRFRFKADVANTGAATLAVSGLSALAIKKKNDQDVATGDIEAGQIVEVVYDGTDFQMQSQVATSAGVDIQEFTADGTWTKPAGAKTVDVYLFGAGGGGGSGNSADNNGNGGGGGGGGGFVYKRFRADALSATEAVVVGVGGTGGASVSSGTNPGLNGTAGEASSFGTNLLVANGGSLGVGGASGDPGDAGAGGTQTLGEATAAGGAGGAGGGAGSGGSAASDLTTGVPSPRGGGGGGGCNGANTSGGAGGGFSGSYVKAGGAAATAGAATDSDLLIGGVGGGGGGGKFSAGTADSGGAGGFPGGGGGGGGSKDTTPDAGASGAGGNGADGLVVVISYLT